MDKLDFSKIEWWSGEPKPSKYFIDKVNAQLSKLQDSLENMPKKAKNESGETEFDLDLIEKKSKLLEGLIKHYLDLTKVLDQRRGDYYKAALQMTAIGLTGFGLLIKLISFSPITVVSLLSISVCLGLLSMLGTAFWVIDKYYWQGKSERYHFLKIDAPKTKIVGNSWMWFYHGVAGIGNIPYTSNPTSNDKLMEDQKAGVEGYLAGAEFFFEQFNCATTEDIYRQNLKHTYALLIHNAYKNKFDRQLTDIMHKGTRTTFFIVSIAIVVSLFSWILPCVNFSNEEDQQSVELKTDTVSVEIIKPIGDNHQMVTPASLQTTFHGKTDSAHEQIKLPEDASKVDTSKNSMHKGKNNVPASVPPGR